MKHYINLPLKNSDIEKFNIGDQVFITGNIITGRDAAHKRLYELYNEKKKLPINLSGEIIYYVGPTPSRPGCAIGSAGPTTSHRMDKYTPTLLKLGLKGMIGKGVLSENVNNAIKEYNACYFTTFGGCGALLANSIKKSEIIAFEDLGTEAIHRLYIENFPVIVSIC